MPNVLLPSSKYLPCLLIISLLCACEIQKLDPRAQKSDDVAADNSKAMAQYQGKPPTQSTLAVLQNELENLPTGDFRDNSLMVDHSLEKLIAKLPASMGTINYQDFAFFTQERPKSIHPSLFSVVRQTFNQTGLYEVADNIYQIRGDLSHITLVRGKRGWIVLDPGTSKEFSGQAWQFARKLLPGGESVPVSAIVYSHSHVDHFGGVKGFVSQQQVDSGEVEIIAPHGFMAEALAENVIAGDAMMRRARYQFGSLLDAKSDGTEFSSLGVALAGSLGTYTLIAPTRELPSGQGIITKWKVDGVQIEFKDISDAEAPAATIMYLPAQKTIFNSELMIRGMHNIYTLRGAKVRDALAWSKLINEVIGDWGQEVETIIGPHGPSFSGNQKIVEYMKAQRDNYGFVHNQSVRLINNGVKLQDVGQELAEMVPTSLSNLWHTHGYHGTYSHNARGVVNRYLGFYDGNPANLNPLQLKPEAEKYVDYMGGADSIMSKAQVDYDAGNYRFVATVVNKLVTAQPNNWPARHLLADAYEQLGYQSEGPQWRNPYLSAAKELRTGEIVIDEDASAQTDLLSAATPEDLLDAMAARINAPKAADKLLSFVFEFPDLEQSFFVELANGNMSYRKLGNEQAFDAKLTIEKATLLRVFTGEVGLMEMLKLGAGGVDGSLLDLISFLRLIDKNEKYYELVPMPKQ